MKDLYQGKTILITGGTGSIGSELAYQTLQHNPRQIRIFSRDEHKHFLMGNEYKGVANIRFILGDVRDKANLRMAMDGVDIVLHAAALKHVPQCEHNPIEAVKTNVYGTQNVIEVAVEKNITHVVLISTDKATSPAGTLGASKLLAEKLMSAAQYRFGNNRTRFCSVRFGNVLGSRGSILNLFKEQIKKGGPVNVTDIGMTRFLMSIPDAATLVLKAAHYSKGGEVFILKMPAVNLKDMVDAAIEHYAPLYGHEPEKIKMNLIGMRPGERLHETLLTEEEVSSTFESKDMFIVFPPLVEDVHERNMAGYGEDVKPCAEGSTYNSNKVVLMDKKAIVKLIDKYEADLEHRTIKFN